MSTIEGREYPNYKENGGQFRRMKLQEAAAVVLDATDRLVDFDSRSVFALETIFAIHDAAYSRKRSGFITNPTDRVEVQGLVNAALGGNTHLLATPLVRSALDDYTVGFLQTDAVTIERLRIEQVTAVADGLVQQESKE